MPLKPTTSDRLAKPVGPFSPAVRDGDRVYTSGQIAQDPATGKLIEGGVVAALPLGAVVEIEMIAGE